MSSVMFSEVPTFVTCVGFKFLAHSCRRSSPWVVYERIRVAVNVTPLGFDFLTQKQPVGEPTRDRAGERGSVCPKQHR